MASIQRRINVDETPWRRLTFMQRCVNAACPLGDIPVLAKIAMSFQDNQKNTYNSYDYYFSVSHSTDCNNFMGKFLYLYTFLIVV